MALRYTTVERMIMSGPEKGKKKTFGIATQGETLRADEVEEWISRRTRIHVCDVKRVFYELESLVREQLAGGRGVQVGKLGSFRLSLQTTPSEDYWDFSQRHIKGVKVNFTVNRKLKLDKRDVRFTRCYRSEDCCDLPPHEL